MKPLIAIIVVFIMPHFGYTQNYANDINILRKKYAANRYGANITINLYSQHQGGTLLETQQVSYNLWDAMLAMHNKQFVTISNKKHYVFVDHNQKSILVNKTTNYKNNLYELSQIQQTFKLIDSVSVNQISTKLVENSPQERSYLITFINAHSNIKSIGITFNPTNFEITKIYMFYDATLTELMGKYNEVKGNTKPRTEIIFNKMEFYTKLNPNWFATDEFITINGKSITLTPSYKSYQLLNLITNKP